MAKNKIKHYILDTSVILHDHNSIKSFENNNIIIPITVLEELDNFKKGNDTKNFEARQFIRLIDKLTENYQIGEWTPIGEGLGNFKIFIDEHHEAEKLNIFHDKKNDHKILAAALLINQQIKGSAVLVTKDINLRVKAKALGLKSEDYLTGKVNNVSSLYTGKEVVELPSNEMINKIFKKEIIDASQLIREEQIVNNKFFIFKSGKSSVLAYYNPFTQELEKVDKQYVSGIKPRNAEQAFAIHALLNNEVKLVSLQGIAGTGKTLIALASALEQKNLYKQFVLARPIVPLSNRDIGYLPGDALEKVAPYMEPLWDNLKFIKNQYRDNEKRLRQIVELEQDGRLIVTPLAYIRGRSFSDTFLIIDEAQNLTPHEVKTIITRAGDNCKIVFTGDIHQIDTPYLDEQSNGLSYMIAKLKGQELYAHITLEKGERSELANIANEYL